MPGEASGARILIIEDDPIEAKDEASQLTRAGYEVRIAFTGRDGLRLLSEYRPDVVLLGLALPDIWGLDLCATIAQTSDAYILLTSGYSAEDIKSTGLELGADDLLMRPFPSEELLARVNAFLRRVTACTVSRRRASSTATSFWYASVRPSNTRPARAPT